MVEQLYRDNYPIVYGYLLSLCGDAHLAEELTAEVFLRAVEKIRTYDPQYRASTWLCTIGRNLYLDVCKRQKRTVPLSDDIPCASPSPETLYIEKEQAQAFLRASEKLSPEQRRILFLRLQGMCFRSIGQALGKNENWARVNYFRAKAKIIKEMEENGWNVM